MSRRRRITNAEILRRLVAVELAVYRERAPHPRRDSMTLEARRQLIASDRAIRRARVVPIYMATATRPRRNYDKAEVHWRQPGDDA